MVLKVQMPQTLLEDIGWRLCYKLFTMKEKLVDFLRSLSTEVATRLGINHFHYYMYFNILLHKLIIIYNTEKVKMLADFVIEKKIKLHINEKLNCHLAIMKTANKLQNKRKSTNCMEMTVLSI